MTERQIKVLRNKRRNYYIIREIIRCTFWSMVAFATVGWIFAGIWFLYFLMIR